MKSGWTYDDIPDQSGRVALVTGANSGLGFHTARGLAAKGARVLMACRSTRRGEQAKDKILSLSPQARLAVVELDLGDLSSVETCAALLAGQEERIDILVNNAGVMAISRQETAQGFERQLGVNHLGHFALTGKLLPLLLAASGSRIVNVSSMAHRSGRIDFSDLHGRRSYNRFRAYSQTKLANLLFTFALQRRLPRKDAPPLAVAAHPGWSETNLQYAAARERGSRLEIVTMRLLNALFSQDAAQGALPQLYAAAAPGVEGGDYIGPGGWMEIRGFPRKVTAVAAARDEDAAQRLWDISVSLTGESYPALQA